MSTADESRQPLIKLYRPIPTENEFKKAFEKYILFSKTHLGTSFDEE
jgi:hypothetical protein